MWKWIVGAIAVVAVVTGLVWAKLGTTGVEYTEHTIQQKEVTKHKMSVPGVQNRIKQYMIRHGTYPESLDDIEDLTPPPDGWIYQYDARNGTVAMVRNE